MPPQPGTLLVGADVHRATKCNHLLSLLGTSLQEAGDDDYQKKLSAEEEASTIANCSDYDDDRWSWVIGHRYV